MRRLQVWQGKTREVRRNEREQRDSIRATRNNTQQLKLLDSRLGVGVGARKERARLMNVVQ